MLKTRNGKETPEIKEDKKAKARQEAEAARIRARQQNEAEKIAKEMAARAKKEAAVRAREMARQAAVAARQKAKEQKKAEKTAKMATAWVKKELEADAKRNAKHEVAAAALEAKQEKEVAQKAKVAAAWAKKEADAIAKKKAEQEAEAMKKAREATALAKKLSEERAREKAAQEAEALKKSQAAAATAKKEAEALAKEKARQEAEAASKVQAAAAAPKKEAEALAKEKARQEAEALKKSQATAAAAKKEAETVAKEKAKQQAEALKKSQAAAAAARKEAEALAKEKARQEAEEAKKARQAAAMAVKEAESIARQNTPQPIMEPKKLKEAPARVKKAPEIVSSPAPFFSIRSILIMVVGLIIGASLGLGYWVYNPFGSPSTIGTGTTQPSKLQTIGLPSNTPWKNDVKVQIVSTGSAYVDLRDLASTGQYYAAKASSLPFLQFMSNALAKDAPQYNHTVDELSQMITAKFDTKSAQPTIIISTVAKSTDETSFLSTYIPTVFKQYLVAETNDSQQQEYQDVANKVDQVKVQVVQATNELNTIKQKYGLTDVTNDPAYVALNAKIEALDQQLKSEASALVNGNADQTLQTKIDQTMQERDTIIKALAKAESELKALDLKYALADTTAYNANLVTLNAQVSALESELNRLMVGDTTTVGLATLIAQGKTSTDTDYNNAMTLINQTSKSLVDTKQQITTLESQLADSNDLALTQDYQLAQAKVDTMRTQLTDATSRLASLNLQMATNANQPTLQEAFDNTSVALTAARTQLAALESTYSNSSFVSANLEYQLAQSKVNDLNTQLSSLTAKLTSLVATNTDSTQITDSLVAGNPSIPTPVLPEKMRMRNALMIGALIGIALGWFALNYKWIFRSRKSEKLIKEDDVL